MAQCPQRQIKGGLYAKKQNSIPTRFSLPDFLKSYGTESQCRKALFKMRWRHGFVCPNCEGTEYYELKVRELYQCKSCHRQTSVTSGTIFDATKLPLTTWLLGIYLLTQSKDGISSLNLARTLGISANAALRMKHKIQYVMKKRDENLPLSGYVQIDDVYLGGKRHGGKRGRGSENKTPFIAAVMTNEKGHPLFMRLSKVTGFTKDEITHWAKKHLTPGTTVISDGAQLFPRSLRRWM